MRDPCPKCGRIHPRDMAVARNRFTDTATYQAKYPGAPIRETRGQAENDQCHRWWEERHALRYGKDGPKP